VVITVPYSARAVWKEESFIEGGANMARFRNASKAAVEITSRDTIRIRAFLLDIFYRF
jgi:hypothetical protein